MKILLAVETLYPGGAEMFVLRLAAALSKQHEVILFRFYKDVAEESLIQKYPASFTHAWPSIPLDRLWRFADRALRLLRIDFSFRNLWVKRSLKHLLKSFNPQVIHSNQVKVDYLMAQVKGSRAFVITLHGDYKTFDELKNSTRSILNFDRKLNTIVSHKPAFVYLADTQLTYLKSKGIGNDTKLLKIYNGYFNEVQHQPVERSAFTFGMIARGIPEKGWQLAIDAFVTVNSRFPHTRLLLVGDSAYMQQLKVTYATHTSIHFAGQTSDPIHWILQMHVGLLPSYYSSESLPTSVIEYLLCGLPVLASDAGEIENMIKSTNESAGYTLHLQQHKADAAQLSLLMEKYVTDQDLYMKHSALARQAFMKFDMQTCVEAYETLYQVELQTR